MSDAGYSMLGAGAWGRPDRFDSLVQDIPFKCSQIHILLKRVWKFLKNKPYTGTQNKSQ